MLCAVLANGSGSYVLFAVLFICFATGTLAAELLFGRPVRGFRFPAEVGGAPVVANPTARQRPPTQPRSLPAPKPATTRKPRATSDAAVFGASRDAGSLVEITVLAANGPRMPDPAEGAVPHTSLLQRDDRPVRETHAGAGASRGLEADQPAADGRQAEERESATPQATRPHEAAGDILHPFPGAVRARTDGRSPESGYRVKGNSRSKLYHTMQSPYYERTKATVWFRTAAEAERAGFSPWNWRTRNDN